MTDICGTNVNVSGEARTMGNNNDSLDIVRDIDKFLGVGCPVEDLGKIYLLYCEYAHCVGFSVRRGEQRYVGKSNVIKWKDYLCSAAGMPDNKCSSSSIPSYRKMIKRTGCKAKVRVRRGIGGSLMISEFVKEHNHPMVPPDQVHLLRSARSMSNGHKSILEALHCVGIGVSKACGFIEKESGGAGNVGFIRQDAYDHIRRTKRATKVSNGDSTCMIEYFSKMVLEDPCFFHKIEVDDDGRLMNFFFRDSRCAHDYALFGDVLSIDTTYRTNRYNLICAPFIGINHHGNNVMMGIGFLSDETTSSFEWLFKAFLQSMNGRQPTCIFTDQCKAMMNAIDTCFQNCKHRLCQWHINQNAPSHFGSLNDDIAFKMLWQKCMNHVDSEEEFEEVWNDMINGYLLGNNKWFRRMYKIRRRWASVYSDGIFTAGLLATSRSESTNKVLKELVGCSGSLNEFIASYEKIQERWREKERVEDTLSQWEPGQFVVNNPILLQSAKIYTRQVYKSFEFEVAKTFNVELCPNPMSMVDGELHYTALCISGNELQRVVKYNVDTHRACCSCHKFENEGLLCSHILKVYYTSNVRAVPAEYFLKRWSKNARVSLDRRICHSPPGDVMPYILFMNNIMRCVSRLVSLTKDDTGARQILQASIDKAREAVYEKIDNNEEILNSHINFPACSNPPFTDPPYSSRRGFCNARLARQFTITRRKFKKKRKNVNDVQAATLQKPSLQNKKNKAKKVGPIQKSNAELEKR